MFCEVREREREYNKINDFCFCMGDMRWSKH